MYLRSSFICIGVFCLSILITNFSLAQEQLGLKSDNYAGVNSLFLNPAATANSPFKWDLNLVGLSHFTENNYAFIENTKLIEILRNTGNIEVATEIDTENPFNENALILDFFFNNEEKHLYTLTQVIGPSIMIKTRNGQAFSLHTAVKAGVSAQKIPSSLGYYNFVNQDFYEGFDMAPFKASGMSWGEIGLNYAKKIPTNSDHQLTIGTTIKALLGFDAFSLQNKEVFTLERLPQNSLRFSNVDVAAGITRSTIDDPQVNPTINGKGASIDLGFTYSLAAYDDTDYQQRYSIAILDLGRIFFNKNTELHTFNETDIVEITTETYDNIQDGDEFFTETSNQVLNNSMASLSDTKMAFWMPTALSLQADYKLLSKVFINALIIQRIPMPGKALQRSNMWALTPRFDSRWLGFSIPISLYELSDLHFGAALRLGPLTIGTENLQSILLRSNFTGTDVYAALKVNPFDLNFRKRPKRSKGFDCYEF